MDNKNRLIVMKIMGYIDKIFHYVSCAEKADFLANSQLVEACVFNLMQIGELAGRVDGNFQERYENIPWHKLRGLRNRLVHDYEGVNVELIWDIINKDLHALRHQLEKTQR